MSSGLAPSLSNSYREGDPRHIMASPLKAERVLGFRAAIAFDDGVERFSRESLRAPPREVVAC
jgi:dTDP-L-rhamnose 4-epimerase